MSTSDLLTLKETAVVAGVSPDLLKREVKHGVVRGRYRNKLVHFPDGAALYFAVIAGCPFELPRALRRDLYDVLTMPHHGTGMWEVDHGVARVRGDAVETTLDCSRAAEQVEQRKALLARRATRIHSDPEVMGGQPVFVGTRIPIENVRGQLMRGAPIEELLEHYPRLSREDIELARLLNEIGPPRGRPKKIVPIKIRRV